MGKKGICKNTGRTHFPKGHIPWNKGKLGSIPWNKGKKGLQASWNKGTKGVMKAWNKGKKFLQISGENHYNWKGGNRKDSYGYVLIYKPEHPFCNKNNYIAKHRLVIENKIKRYLFAIEEVHHINKIKSDNRLKNLIAFINDKAHKRFEHNPNNVKSEEIIFDGRNLR